MPTTKLHHHRSDSQDTSTPMKKWHNSTMVSLASTPMDFATILPSGARMSMIHPPVAWLIMELTPLEISVSLANKWRTHTYWPHSPMPFSGTGRRLSSWDLVTWPLLISKSGAWLPLTPARLHSGVWLEGALPFLSVFPFRTLVPLHGKLTAPSRCWWSTLSRTYTCFFFSQIVWDTLQLLLRTRFGARWIWRWHVCRSSRIANLRSMVARFDGFYQASDTRSQSFFGCLVFDWDCRRLHVHGRWCHSSHGNCLVA